MKKLVFTAIAVIAFSGVSMAETREAKKEVLPPTDCQTKAMDYIDNVYDKDGTHTAMQNYDAYHAYLAGCQQQ